MYIQRLGLILVHILFISNLARSENKHNSIQTYQIYLSKPNQLPDPSFIINDKNKLDKSINATYSLLKDKTIDKSKKFELLIRLGKLHLDRYDLVKHIEDISYDRRYKEYSNKRKEFEKRGFKYDLKNLKEPLYTEHESRKELKKAIKTLNFVVNKFQSEDRIDEALFILGQTKSLFGDPTGNKNFKTILQKFPKSILVPDANLALGEYYFDKREFLRATYHYQKMLNYKEHKGYLYAIYKLAWSHYNLSFIKKDKIKFLKKSLAGFKIVIKSHNYVKSGKVFNLKQEAMNDIILVFAEVGDVDTARKFFTSLGDKKRFYKSVMKIGDKKTASGNNLEAINVYNLLIREDPYNDQVPEAFIGVISNLEMLGKFDKVTETLIRYGKYVGKSGFWYHSTQLREDSILKKERLKFATKLFHYGTKYHKMGQKSADQHALLTAAKIYKQYLHEFPTEKKSYETRYYLADILKSFKSFEQSAKHFLIVARTSQNQNLKRKSIDYAIGALEKIIPKFRLTDLKYLSKPKIINRASQMYLDAMETLIKSYPNDSRRISYTYRIPYILYHLGHYESAFRKFYRFIEKNQDSILSIAASEIIVNHYYNLEKWKEVIKTCSRLFHFKNLIENKKFNKWLLATNKRSYFKLGLDLEKKRYHLDAAKVFDEFQQKYPSHREADKALYNSSINYLKARKTDKSIEIGEKLIKNYPNSNLTKDVTLWISTTLEMIANYERAIDYYFLFYKKYRTDSRSRQNLFNATILSIGLEDYKKCEKYIKLFIAEYPNDKRVDFLKFNLARLYTEYNKDSLAMEIYESLSLNARSEENRLEAKALTIVLLQNNDKKIASTKIRIFSKQLKKSNAVAYNARRLISKELMSDVELRILNYNKLAINDGNKLMEQISTKNRVLKNIANMLESIAEIGVSEYSVAALYLLGELHEEMGKSVANAPLPRRINDDEKANIKLQISSIEEKLINDSTEFYKRSYRLSQTIQTFSDWNIKVTRKINELHSDIIKTSEAETLEPDYLSHSLVFNKSTEKLINN